MYSQYEHTDTVPQLEGTLTDVLASKNEKKNGQVTSTFDQKPLNFGFMDK